MRTLTGRILTIVDASYGDAVQRKAVKDLVKQAIWWGWAEHLDRSEPDMPVGIPGDLEDR